MIFRKIRNFTERGSSYYVTSFTWRNKPCMAIVSFNFEPKNIYCKLPGLQDEDLALKLQFYLKILSCLNLIIVKNDRFSPSSRKEKTHYKLGRNKWSWLSVCFNWLSYSSFIVESFSLLCFLQLFVLKFKWSINKTMPND